MPTAMPTAMNGTSDAPAAAGKPESCQICGMKFEGSAEHRLHVESERHFYNSELVAFKKDRKGKSKNRHGIEINITCPNQKMKYIEAKGIAETTIDFAKPGIKYCFAIKNVGENPATLKNAFLLHPLKSFTLQRNVTAGLTTILTGQAYQVFVSFKNTGIGYYDVPVCFSMCCGQLEFNIIKEISITVSRESSIETEGTEDESPFKGEIWESEKMTRIQGIERDGTHFRTIMSFRIPNEYLPIFKHKLEVWKDISADQIKTLTGIRSCYPSSAKGNKFRNVYQKFFHDMLHLDEYANKAQLRTFNMSNVPMILITQDHVRLKIPGLEEKRPSIIKNDIILARIRKTPERWESIAYEGKIAKVNESDVWISGFDPRLMYQLEEAALRNEVMRFDVRFTLNRYPLSVMHRALDLTVSPRMLNMLFPDSVKPMKPIALKGKLQCRNPLVSGNPEQLCAVTSILQGTSRPAPYIIFGPPGTGKTVTIVEAIIQIKNMFQKTHILVCASSNAACDHLASKLKDYCSTEELLRLNANSREWNTIPEDLVSYCNQTGQNHFSMPPAALDKFRIIVCTLITASRFHAAEDSGFKKNFTHVFIDEAGQAKEPEALAGIAGILGPASPGSPGGQLILAGDPKQLGPICSSRDSDAAGLGISMLERLMATCKIYQRKKDRTYDSHYITKLLHNFRSHPALLEIPNRLFYEGELKVSASKEILNDAVGSVPLFTNSGAGYPLVFHGVIGQERKEGKSPSFFNQMEIDTVMHYLSILLDRNAKVSVQQSDIGVISPYIRQVYKLKGLIKRKGWDNVEVGTTEVFQGREKRVILISTVRASRNLLAGDKKYKLGFLNNEKRFNVAVTRARSLLVVIGCPHILETDPRWKELIALTKQHNSYHGCEFSLSDAAWTNEVIEKFENLLKNDN